MAYELVSAFEQGEWILRRGVEVASRRAVFAVTTTHGESARLRRSWELRDELDPDACLRPLAYDLVEGRHHLVLPDPGGQVLAQLATPLGTVAALRAGLAIAEALKRFHARGFVHRDVKPSSILYAADEARAWLAGTGLALRVSSGWSRNEPLQGMVGTPAYMAPEQTGRVDWPVDTRSDLYSLGIVMYELLTGSLPFEDDDPLAVIHAQIARTPEAPNVRRDDIPGPVSAIVLRLIAKDPKDRYQTAAGLAWDLRTYLERANAPDPPFVFRLGERDVPDQLRVPDRVVGREPELAALDHVFDRVAQSGRPELVLVEGSSGVGKSALIEEVLRRAVARGRVAFVGASKLDPVGRGTPLASLGRALASLLPDLHNDPALAADLRATVAPYGRLLLGILPELRGFFASEPDLPDLQPRDAHIRFQQLVRAFVGAFARRGSVALFLDDLQWIDAATLAMLRALISRSEIGPVLVVAAYRSNEIDATLLAEVEEIAKPSAHLVLSPLGPHDVSSLVGAMVNAAASDVRPLADLVFGKTAGNPFFTIQFMLSLAEDRLVRFDAERLAWAWDLAAVEARGFTDNVVDTMLARLERLPARSREALVHLAFIGDAAAPALLAVTLGADLGVVHSDLEPAVRAGLVALTTAAYVFLHDRVRESAYAIVADPVARATLHRRIGERLFEVDLPGTVFDVFWQLDRGVSVADATTGVRDAMVALAAAREAKGRAAYGAAHACLAAGAARLPENGWEVHHQLAFDIDIMRAECELFLGEPAVATDRLSGLARRTRDLSGRALVTRHLMNAHVTMGRPDLAMDVGLAYLRAVGVAWPLHPTDEYVASEIARTRALVSAQSIESLVDLPVAEDAVSRDTLDQVLVDLGAPALFFDRNLFQLSVFGTINYALEHGVSSAAAWMFAVAAMVFVSIHDDAETSRRFAHVARGLADRFASSTFSARTRVTLAHHVIPWLGDCRGGDPMLEEARAAMHNGGELMYLGYVNMHMVTHAFANGAPLPRVEEEAAAGKALAASANIPYIVADIDHQLTLVRTLRGLTPTFGTLDDEGFREQEFEARLATPSVPINLRARYWIRKLVARYFAGHYAEAVAAADAVRPLLWSSGGPFGPHFRDNADYHFFGALARAALGEPGAQRERLEEHRERYTKWAATAPATYASRKALIDAELSRLDGGNAGPLFERAIALARESGFVHHESVALEVAARYWASQGYAAFAEAYRSQACDAYRRWGADGKVQELEARFPEIRVRGPLAALAATVERPAEQLDLATALAVSDAVSSEIDHERLVRGLLSTAVRTAGAQRAVLLLPGDAGMVPEADATTRDDGVDVHLRREGKRSVELCEGLVRYVASTGTALVLDDAAATGPFAGDPYVVGNRCRSLACVPLTRRGQLGGVLYLENNLATRVFTARRLVTMHFVASQAATALENARLYADLSRAHATEQALHQTREALGHLARVATLGELTASIAHEVSQPLAAIRLNAATCVRWMNAGKIDEAAAAAARVARDAEQSVEVIQRLRSLFRKQSTERCEVDLNDAVAEVAALTRSEMTKNQIVAEIRLAPESPHVLGSRVQIQQVVMNLVLNAIHALQEIQGRARQLLVTTRLAEGRSVRTSVRDGGPGVPGENVAALFRPFFSTKKEGTGVGLSISQSIVASHDGRMWYAPNDGPGATFGFDLPLSSPTRGERVPQPNGLEL
jgi:predicted ATPase/signal transduction histidine kinase